MKEKKKEIVLYPGMFDYLKGIAMISIVVTHVMVLYKKEMFGYRGDIFSLNAVLVALWSILTMGKSLIVLYLIISGFGFNVKKKGCLKKQAKQLLKPFAITAIVTTILHLVVHYACFRYLPGSIDATINVFAGYVLGASKTLIIGDRVICSIGSVWFLIMLFISWNILNYIYLKIPEKYVGMIVVIIASVGVVLGNYNFMFPYAIIPAMVAVGWLYIGYLIKKKNWLTVKIPVWGWFLIVIIAMITQIWGEVSVSDGYWKNSFFDIVGVACIAFLYMRVALRLNQYHLPFQNQIGLIGRYSIWIMCIHTVETQGLPWYLMVEKFGADSYGGFFIILLIKAVIIYCGYRVVLTINNRKIKKRSENRRIRKKHV